MDTHIESVLEAFSLKNPNHLALHPCSMKYKTFPLLEPKCLQNTLKQCFFSFRDPNPLKKEKNKVFPPFTQLYVLFLCIEIWPIGRLKFSCCIGDWRSQWSHILALFLWWVPMRLSLITIGDDSVPLYNILSPLQNPDVICRNQQSQKFRFRLWKYTTPMVRCDYESKLDMTQNSHTYYFMSTSLNPLMF